VSERAKEEACAGDDEQQCCMPVEQLVKFVWGLLAQGATAAAVSTTGGASTGAQLSVTLLSVLTLMLPQLTMFQKLKIVLDEWCQHVAARNAMYLALSRAHALLWGATDIEALRAVCAPAMCAVASRR
jgi:hypothetical protein